MTALKYYIGFGIILKIGGLIFFSHYGDSALMALIYAALLLIFLALRPSKKTSSFL